MSRVRSCNPYFVKSLNLRTSTHNGDSNGGNSNIDTLAQLYDNMYDDKIKPPELTIKHSQSAYFLNGKQALVTLKVYWEDNDPINKFDIKTYEDAHFLNGNVHVNMHVGVCAGGAHVNFSPEYNCKFEK